MEKDFHYYGTYAASRLAGYNDLDAQTIAYAAQYVDDSTLTQINKALNISQIATLQDYMDMTLEDWKKLEGIDFIPIVTSQTNFEIFESNMKTNFNQNAENELRRIWCLYHFLPGNTAEIYGENIDYNGKLEYNTTFFKWKYGERSKWELRLLCRKSTRLVEFMINDIISSGIETDLKNFLIGIRMHVLADTWAHMWYTGTPSWCMNECGQHVYNDTNGKHDEVSWGPFPGQEISTPPAISFYSAAYLGHGRMGHLPDLPWLKEQYTPQWSSKELLKDNPSEFLVGLKQMVTALKCIRENKPFEVENIDNTLDIDTINNIYATLAYEQQLGVSDEKRLQERCSMWKDKLKQGLIIKEKVDVPDYNLNAWVKTNPNFKKFHLAAQYHEDSLFQELYDTGINLFDPPAYDGY